MTQKLLDPIPPGEILLEEFMKPMGVSINTLSRDVNVPPNRISEIVNGKRSITADSALRLGKYFSVSPEIWLDLQSDYDIRVAHPSENSPQSGEASLHQHLHNCASICGSYNPSSLCEPSRASIKHLSSGF